MHLYDVWFIAIAVLWTGYFFLEGFDFGVGVLTRFLARDDRERRVMINTIGPVWDGNEVWLITAGGATFAAFPEWYATLFSGFYIPLLLILIALILRAVAFDYRGKGDTRRWKDNWDRCIFYGSLIPAILWGVAFGNIVRGVKLNADHDYVGTLFDLLNPYALLGGLVTLTVFTYHGSVYIALKTDGEIRARANRFSLVLGAAALVVAAGFLVWTLLLRGDTWSLGTAVLAAVLLAASVAVSAKVREGWAFALSGLAIVAFVATLFLSLFPYVMPSTIADANSLTVENASSTAKTLGIMTWVAVIFLPIVLLYQSWTYWVFRKRISVHHIPDAEAAPSPAAP
ncbi:cytochrome d ubiquinol oxidase subunit II [Actinocorallia sp. API 0066]|uniref:cytochrome d ubiquinol oxidase subunit II n=1 Tax=Actinocorallia sp. API 0066 TaxID=2896846 RepID=UPI001E5FD3F9|nr:cytochrome d ubiquinol oxidase subunit II [Actinocorallia sp. API 0066]MCD0448131.1 cytochrome d ubiquinol oxidase subunit II [Actinocorallia sp. API 0066]